MNTQSTLLMIDLAPDDLVSLQTLLADEGYHLLAAAGIAQALDMLEREQVDVVIGDISLPDSDGTELCRQIRQQPDLEELPVLLIAAAEDHQARLQSLQAGADDFISKPLSFTEVCPRLRTITRLNQFRQLAEQSDRLAFLTLYDPQTLLPNERYLNQYLPDELRQSRQRGQSVALLYIDLDGFQMINSTLGSRVTDLLLQEAVTRLRLMTEPDPCRRLVRMGNDKFIIVQTECCNILELAQTADQIQQAIQAPMLSQAGEMRLTASIGISVFPQDAGQRRADRGRSHEHDVIPPAGPGRLSVCVTTYESAVARKLASGAGFAPGGGTG
ncbi:MAG: diguanylate cyclase [Gammaproteobacteria bacterium]